MIKYRIVEVLQTGETTYYEVQERLWCFLRWQQVLTTYSLSEAREYIALAKTPPTRRVI